MALQVLAHLGGLGSVYEHVEQHPVLILVFIELELSLVVYWKYETQDFLACDFRLV
jgi:hypothetical protein